MNIKEDLTCKYCREIYKNPITLICCGDNICKQHIEELISISKWPCRAEQCLFFSPFSGTQKKDDEERTGRKKKNQ